MRKWGIWVLTVILVFMCVACDGASLQEALIGTWTVAVDTDRDMYPETDTLIFYPDGTMSDGRHEYTYTVDELNSRLTISADRLVMDHEYSIELDEDNTYLSLQYGNEDALVYIKED